MAKDTKGWSQSDTYTKIYGKSIMPFQIKKVQGGYKLYNTDTKRYSKPLFKTKQSAINQRRNWMRYSKTTKTTNSN